MMSSSGEGLEQVFRKMAPWLPCWRTTESDDYGLCQRLVLFFGWAVQRYLVMSRESIYKNLKKSSTDGV